MTPRPWHYRRLFLPQRSPLRLPPERGAAGQPLPSLQLPPSPSLRPLSPQRPSPLLLEQNAVAPRLLSQPPLAWPSLLRLLRQRLAQPFLERDAAGRRRPSPPLLAWLSLPRLFRQRRAWHLPLPLPPRRPRRADALPLLRAHASRLPPSLRARGLSQPELSSRLPPSQRNLAPQLLRQPASGLPLAAPEPQAVPLRNASARRPCASLPPHRSLFAALRLGFETFALLALFLNKRDSLLGLVVFDFAPSFLFFCSALGGVRYVLAMLGFGSPLSLHRLDRIFRVLACRFGVFFLHLRELARDIVTAAARRRHRQAPDDHRLKRPIGACQPVLETVEETEIFGPPG